MEKTLAGIVLERVRRIEVEEHRCKLVGSLLPRCVALGLMEEVRQAVDSTTCMDQRATLIMIAAAGMLAVGRFAEALEEIC